MTMADEKRYFSVKDMFEQAVTRAKTDPRYKEYSKICELDYDLLCSTCKYVRGKVILQSQGKEFFTWHGKDFFT